MMGAIRGQRAAFSCQSINWFLDRVRWQPAHRPLALGAAPKGINQLAVSTQILASAMVIHILRKQQAHPIKQENSCNIWTHSVRESTISAEDLIGYWGKKSSDLCCTSPLSVLAGGSCEEEYDGNRECKPGTFPQCESSHTLLCAPWSDSICCSGQLHRIREHDKY